MPAWNTPRSVTGPRTLHGLFERQVQRSPHRVAVTDGSRCLSYSELEVRVGYLAQRLKSLGVGPEVLVGVSMERSVEMVVSLLGILTAGGAYLPLDPSYPRERLGFMAADSGVDVLITQSWLMPRLPPCGTVLPLDPGTLIEETRLPHRYGAEPENPAYVMYTSGSTGSPKGVLIPHRGIVNRLLWMQSAYRLNGSDRVLQKTPFSFDVSVWEFFWPLSTGACVVMAPPESHRDPSLLARLIHEQGITTLHFVPSMLQVFLGERALPVHTWSVRRVFVSGEALPQSLHARFFERVPVTELHNLYGPTEASVDVTFHTCRADAHSGAPPIGRPISNMTAHVLGADLRPTAIGVLGELHLGGVGLGRGYLGQPGLTARQFVPDSETGQPGSRLYKTGDLTRYREDGEVEFLGRSDHQVKVRGVRIELGEIEAELSNVPGVIAAAAKVETSMAEEPRLVGYVVAARVAALTGAGLRDSLVNRLPEPMIPSLFVLLENLPTTPNGKVDRQLLTPALGTRPAARQPFVAPRSQREELISQAWQDVLGVPSVGIDDNFLEVGGDSFRLIQLASRLRSLLGREVAIAELFRYPTVRSQAQHLEAQEPDHQAVQQGRGRARARVDARRSRRLPVRRRRQQ